MGHFLHLSTKQGMMCSCHFLVCQSLHISLQSGGSSLFFFNFSAYKHLDLPNVWSWHTYTHSRAPILCYLLTNSSRQYHLLLHFIKQILIMRRWFNCVRMWPTNLYRVLKWRQTKPISFWDTNYLILLRVLSWEIVCSCISLVLFCTCCLLYIAICCSALLQNQSPVSLLPPYEL